MPVDPVLAPAGAGHRGVLVWRWGVPMRVLSSAPVGGGLGDVRWLVNVGVPSDYRRTDLTRHAGEVAAEFGLSGPGVAMFTAVDLSRRHQSVSEGVTVDATVGITHPTWPTDPLPTSTPADPAQARPAGPGGPASARPASPTDPSQPPTPPGPGTINLVVQVPVALDPGAAVNAVITATEAKSQALAARSVPGTGTATDAVAIVWPTMDPVEPFAGPRSPWGSRIARAVYQAVWAGAGPQD